MATYGLVGKKLSHSFSKRYFEETYGFNSDESRNRYLNFELANISEITSLDSTYPDLAGFNVTIPYKNEIIPYIDCLSDDAAQIGAVNVIKVIHDTSNGRNILEGHNTDHIGFMAAILPMVRSNHTTAMVIGNGGASDSVRFALQGMGIECVCCCRNPKRADDIVFNSLRRSHFDRYKILINTTPLGTWPGTSQMPPIPVDFVDESHLVFDLVYNPEETLLMRESRLRGAVVSNGLQMLRNQADLALQIWGIKS
ncbi:MAG: shikimate dehydrogenase family protein [Bacteroidota bacterium]